MGRFLPEVTDEVMGKFLNEDMVCSKGLFTQLEEELQEENPVLHQFLYGIGTRYVASRGIDEEAQELFSSIMAGTGVYKLLKDQIQINSSQKIRCLPVVSQGTIDRFIEARKEAKMKDFGMFFEPTDSDRFANEQPAITRFLTWLVLIRIVRRESLINKFLDHLEKKEGMFSLFEVFTFFHFNTDDKMRAVKILQSGDTVYELLRLQAEVDVSSERGL